MSAVPAGESLQPPTFRDLALSEPVLRALTDVGYEAPSPIQAATIPVLLSGADMLGQAQTGTGKTAAFALPALSRIELTAHDPQVLVLVPTRELALQVAEAFQRYAAHLKGFHVLPIYGGQSYQPQLNALRRGVHVVVGTPGRIIDHMNRGTLKLSGLTLLVLDEADEMLQMGFVDAVESILEQTPPQRQVALFSATLPAPIRRIAQKHLRTPVEVTIKSKTSTATNIRQRYWLVSGMHKLDALTRILEAETFDAMLVFTRTKQATVELAEKLEARGFAAEPLNGDMPQQQRERTVARLKAGQIDILVATDVAARGLDVERIGHVVNYDVPYDTESYVHRVGRTGRAGRKGEAILFIAPRERNMLRAIERATRQTIEPMNLPSGRCRQCAANRQVQGTGLGDRGEGRDEDFPAGTRAAGGGNRTAAHRHRRRAREPRPRVDPAAARGQGGGRNAGRSGAGGREAPTRRAAAAAPRPPRTMPPPAGCEPRRARRARIARRRRARTPWPDPWKLSGSRLGQFMGSGPATSSVRSPTRPVSRVCTSGASTFGRSSASSTCLTACRSRYSSNCRRCGSRAASSRSARPVRSRRSRREIRRSATPSERC